MKRTTAQKHLPRPLGALLRANIPTARPSGARVIGVGFDVIAWRVPDATGDWTLRAPRHPDARPVIAAQTLLTQHLDQHGIPVPREAMLLGGGDGATCGVYRFVEGAPALLAEDEGPATTRLATRLATQLADCLTRLHRTAPPPDSTPSVVRPSEDRFGPIIERCRPHLGGARRAWLERIASRLAALAEGMPDLVLVHADLKPDHVLLGADGTIEAVLDFEGIQVSDPAVDFGRIIQHWGRPFAERVFREYTGATDPEFLERAQIYRDLDGVDLLDTVIEDGAEEWRDLALREIDAAASRSVDASNGQA